MKSPLVSCFDELKMKALWSHPVMKTNKHIKKYYLMKYIQELCENSKGPFSMNTKPEDLIIQDFNEEECYVDVVLKSNQDPTEYNKFPDYYYTFTIHNEETLYEEPYEYFKDNMAFFSPEILYDNIKKYNYTIEPEQPEKVFESEECACCLEKYNDKVIKKVIYCGHIVCQDCYDSLDKCPYCRKDFTNIESIQYKLDDIQRFCDDNDNERLKDIINVKDAFEAMLQYAGPIEMMRCEEGREYHPDVLPEKWSEYDGMGTYYVGFNW